MFCCKHYHGTICYLSLVEGDFVVGLNMTSMEIIVSKAPIGLGVKQCRHKQITVMSTLQTTILAGLGHHTDVVQYDIK